MNLHRFGLLLVALALSGCQSTSSRTNVATDQTNNAVPPPVNTPAAKSSGAADPQLPTGRSFRAQQLLDSMKGISFDLTTEKITIDTAAAAQIAARGTRAEAIAVCNEGVPWLERNVEHEAIARFVKAIIIDPQFADAYTQLGTALRNRNKDKEALCCFRKTAELTPTSVEAFSRIAWQLGRLSRHADEIAAWRTVIKMDPNNGEAHGRLAIALYFNEDLAGALPEIALAQKFGYELPDQFLDQVEKDVQENN